MLNNNEILMHYHYKPNDEYYGTSTKEVQDKLNQGLLIIDETEEESLIELIKNNKLRKDQYSTIYIKAPSIQEAKKRIKLRGGLTEEEIEKRIKHIKVRLDLYEKTKQYYDLEIINDDLKQAYEKLKEFILKV